MMKLFQPCLFLLIAFSAAKAQSDKTFYETPIKHIGYYVVLSDDSSFAYKIGAYKSKGGICTAIVKTTPLQKATGNSYRGDSVSVVMDGGIYFLDRQTSKLRRVRLQKHFWLIQKVSMS